VDPKDWCCLYCPNRPDEKRQNRCCWMCRYLAVLAGWWCPAPKRPFSSCLLTVCGGVLFPLPTCCQQSRQTRLLGRLARHYCHRSRFRFHYRARKTCPNLIPNACPPKQSTFYA
jgi:hypothetical protein